ncbi:GNAT family N-acetyltransferase [Pseudactinotalea sp. HY160]|uniref:GNAT family N-acetyltransferase n=1 Tax=Pseudactinotalea sp. HY160 TaxID=2654490 RepID=UPI00128B7C57|nr:GNAT family N-acetyltransferase [Pseudactinotalea sp. HY160]MPV48558.1 GNAT family N-acetyltransferase [Pseudactinotalea sp. HY160]
MTVPAPYRFVRLGPERRREVVGLDTMVFPTGTSLEDQLTAPDPLTWERTWGIESGPEPGGPLAAIHSTHPLAAYPVPGGHARCGWLTWVGVHPGHRRRGLLRAMIARHLAGCVEAGEVVSGLTAAEPAIYGRFGYGLATRHLELTIPRAAELRPLPGPAAREAAELTVEIADWDPAVHADLVSGVHREHGRRGLGRPGWATWETPALAASRAADTPALRGGLEARKVVLVRGAEVRAYATFRRSLAWEAAGPTGVVRVGGAVGLDPAATHRLWRVLLDLDLMTTIRTPMLALDDPLLEWLLDLRRCSPTYQDNSWLRLVDVPGALTARTLAGDVDVVLELTDDLLPASAGRWRLRGRAWDHPEVTRTDDAAHLSLDVRELSAAYLGGTSLAALARAGLVAAADPGALAAASTALSWPVAPVVDWIF